MTLLRLGLAACLLVCGGCRATGRGASRTRDLRVAAGAAGRSSATPRVAAPSTRSERARRQRRGLGAADDRPAAGRGRRSARRSDFSDAGGGAPVWEERPGTYRWQRARFFFPAATVAGAGQRAATSPSRGSGPARQPATGWAVRVRQGGALSVVGTRDADGAPIEFPVYATLPLDQWMELEIGLHSQAGPGVKRGLRVRRQRQRSTAGITRAACRPRPTTERPSGSSRPTSPPALEAFVDDWGVAGIDRVSNRHRPAVDRRRCRSRTIAR